MLHKTAEILIFSITLWPYANIHPLKVRQKGSKFIPILYRDIRTPRLSQKSHMYEELPVSQENRSREWERVF